MPDGLSTRLRRATRHLHREVEGTEFVRSLLSGTATRRSYVRYLRSLHPVYAALEGVLAERRGHPALAELADPRLERTRRVEADLEFLHGLGWEDAVTPAPTAERYGEHLESLTREEAHRLVGHWYVRYMGDLSGGTMVRDRIADALDLSGEGGLSFYDFDGLEEASSTREVLRARIDRLPLDPTQRREVVAEARRGFRYHLQLFRELYREDEVDRPLASR